MIALYFLYVVIIFYFDRSGELLETGFCEPKRLSVSWTWWIVVTIPRYCEARRKALLDHVYEGYETDIWEYVDYDWSRIFLKIKEN